jgi:hypothetical protein
MPVGEILERYFEESCSKPVICREQAVLLAICQQAARVYSDARFELDRNISTSFKDECDTLYRGADDAKDKVIEARNKLNRHVAEHGC